MYGQYEKKLIEKIISGEMPIGPGTLHHVTVLHDDWCRLLRGKGDCNCDPEIVEGSHDPVRRMLGEPEDD